jgi:hypothetical protein
MFRILIKSESKPYAVVMHVSNGYGLLLGYCTMNERLVNCRMRSMKEYSLA